MDTLLIFLSEFPRPEIALLILPNALLTTLPALEAVPDKLLSALEILDVVFPTLLPEEDNCARA